MKLASIFFTASESIFAKRRDTNKLDSLDHLAHLGLLVHKKSKGQPYGQPLREVIEVS